MRAKPAHLVDDAIAACADELARVPGALKAPGHVESADRLGTLAGQPINGTWRLSVSDTEGQDVGKLNSWRVVIQRA